MELELSWQKFNVESHCHFAPVQGHDWVGCLLILLKKPYIVLVLSTWSSSPLNVGHSSSGRCRNGGPLIQVLTSSGGTALIKTSAELTSDLMYLNVCVSRVSISATLTKTNGLNLLGGLLIQANMVCESIQNTVLASDNSASSSGMDFSFSGATNAFTMSGTQK